MVRTLSITLPPSGAGSEPLIIKSLADACGVKAARISGYQLLKRSLDARSRRNIQVVLQALVFIDEPPVSALPFDPELKDVSGTPHALVIGAGPAGLFAALRLISLGIRPVVLERGKDVRSRRRDLAAMNKEGLVNGESNYCFGEGGAGTYSDGKLYTRSTKRGNVQRILQLFTHFGADPRILYEAHPHIGTNKLPQIITAIREAIVQCGGEVHFGKKLSSIGIGDGAVTGARTADGDFFPASAMILATGHSARDVFELLHHQGIAIEGKPFAIGVRIEHPQELIDSIQYHGGPGSGNGSERSPHLPPASYSLVAQERGRGVFSFCMCPGGIIAPAATAPGEIVVNGWSPSKRNNPYANSGTVVAVDERDFAGAGFSGPLAAMQYQQMVERQAFAAGGGGLVAPAQRMGDFAAGKLSASLPRCSYLPGIRSVPMQEVLPTAVSDALRLALADFGKKMKGYFTNEAVLVATESRTSSPVRIPRDRDTLQHPGVKGLFPCGEGAGYAGGIVSAAIDGERCAGMVAAYAGIKGRHP